MNYCYRFILLLAFSALISPAYPQAQFCDTTGNLVIYANYDGGVLNINCDVNIPNLKIGVCTYEPVTINLSGPFVGNVTEVRYAGYVSTNNNHCNNSPSTTTIAGAPTNAATSVNFLPQSTLTNPNGNNSIVCAYSCNTASSQGGCNTADQIVHYFQTSMNATMRSYFTQYGCWSTTAYSISNGGNCCPTLPGGCNISINMGTPPAGICEGQSSASINASATGATSYSWSPTTGLSCTTCLNPTASPTTTTTYVLTASSGPNCSESDSITVIVYPDPGVTTTPFQDICEEGSPLMLSGASPQGGNWGGPGVSANSFFPALAGPGTHNLIYQYTGSGGCLWNGSETITVLPAPQVSIGPQPTPCEDGIPFPMAGGSPSGGTYSGVGITAGTPQLFSPGFTGPGVHAFSYTYTDANGCSSTAWDSITVIAVPATPVISQVGIDELSSSVTGDSVQWFLNGSYFGSASPNLQTVQSGSYSAVVWLNGCNSAPSGPFVFEFVALENALAAGWQIYPIPASSAVIIQGPQSNIRVILHDLNGRRLLDEKSQTSELQLNLQEFASGPYMLELRQGSEVYFQKLFVER